jgi:nucleoside-diphosphate-sugar epimerase
MLVHQNPHPIHPDRVVLLGAGGFLSPVLAGLLTKEGIPTRALGSKDLDLTADGAAGRLASEIRPQDVVVMAAALTPDKGRTIGTLMKNLRMGETVCETVGRNKPAHFVYISSDGVYDARFSSLLNEQSTCEPADLYCLMHIARERMLEQTCKPAGVPLCIVRPCAIYGPGDTHNSYGPNRFSRTALIDRKIILFGGGEEKRHHVHVDDVAGLIVRCILHRSAGVINVATGTAVSFAEVASIIAGAAGVPVTIEKLPRATPITHRHFDTSLLVQAFPDFRAALLQVGLTAMMRELLRRS